MNILKNSFIKNKKEISKAKIFKNIKFLNVFNYHTQIKSTFTNKNYENKNKFLNFQKFYFAESILNLKNLEFPKYRKVLMPSLSPTMTKVKNKIKKQGNIVEWRKKEGDSITSGEVLASVETDKATVDFEVNEDGYIAKLLYPAGTKDINLGTVIK